MVRKINTSGCKQQDLPRERVSRVNSIATKLINKLGYKSARGAKQK